MKEPLTAKERARYTICRKTISEGLQKCFDTGAAMIEVRDEKYYREDFDTFEEFCLSEYNLARSTAYQIIAATEVLNSLPASSAKLITNESQARALSNIPESDRHKVITQLKKAGEPITAASIKAAVQEPKMSAIADTKAPIESAKPDKTLAKDAIIELDKTGYQIPARIAELWKDAEHILGSMLRRVSEVRTEVRKAMESGEDNPIWRGCSLSSVMVALDNAYREINAGIPYGVCPYCQGQVSKTCRTCNQTGYIGRFGWGAIPKEILEVRSKSCKTK